ncbi:hypothetical protein, partial [Streptomyces sp. NPDC051183]|uniref:hypothetical protein n=1 Tax=Streptomyces sp. NPDC051183 TaxID=3155165 RepID=UPI003412DB9B
IRGIRPRPSGGAPLPSLVRSRGVRVRPPGGAVLLDFVRFRGVRVRPPGGAVLLDFVRFRGVRAFGVSRRAGLLGRGCSERGGGGVRGHRVLQSWSG